MTSPGIDTNGLSKTADGHVGDGDGKKPVTPKERTRAAAKKNAAEDAAGENDEGTTKKKVKTPTKASPGEKTAESGGLRIPKSLEAASDADKMLLRMRDVEGKSWAVITKAWVAATGEEVMNVKGRYYKMKANFTEFKRGDVSAERSTEGFLSYRSEFYTRNFYSNHIFLGRTSSQNQEGCRDQVRDGEMGQDSGGDEERGRWFVSNPSASEEVERGGQEPFCCYGWGRG